MTRVEYIRQLEFSLTGKLPKGEISDILRDYSEYFEAGKAEGKTEEEIVVSLGIPSAVAAEILSENEENLLLKTEEKKEKKGWFRHTQENTDQTDAQQDEDSRLRTDGVLSHFRHWWERLRRYVHSLFHDETEQDKRRPQDAKRAPRAEWERKWSAHGGGSLGRWLLSLLMLIVLIPFVALALFFGGVTLFFAAAAIVGTALVLFLLFVAAVLTAFIGAAAVALVCGYLPASVVVSAVLLLLACLCGGIFALCLCIWTLRGLTRLIRYCLGRRVYLQSARNPVYRAAHAQRHATQAQSDAPEESSLEWMHPAQEFDEEAAAAYESGADEEENEMVFGPEEVPDTAGESELPPDGEMTENDADQNGEVRSHA